VNTLAVIHYPIYGGPHNRLALLGPILREHGVSTTVVLPDGPGSAPERMRAAGLEVVQMPLRRLRARLDPRFHLSFVRGLRTDIRALRQLIRDREIDLVVIGGLVNPQGVFAARDKADVLPALDAILVGLRPGGRLVARVPNAEGPFGARTRYADFTHGTAFTQRSIRQVLAASGFDTISVHPTEPVAHGLLSLIRFGLWKVLALLGRLYLVVETGVTRGHVLTQNVVAVAHKAA